MSKYKAQNSGALSGYTEQPFARDDEAADSMELAVLAQGL